jgi:CheY-like chemotaxis protein
VILLVEDEKNARHLFAKILNNAGYNVVEAADGLEALGLLNEQQCDLVISDILMPNLNGYALAARIRSNWPSIPIVLMSAYVAEETVKAFLNGAVEFISKPIDPMTLLTTIQRLMAQAATAE